MKSRCRNKREQSTGYELKSRTRKIREREIVAKKNDKNGIQFLPISIFDKFCTYVDKIAFIQLHTA